MVTHRTRDFDKFLTHLIIYHMLVHVRILQGRNFTSVSDVHVGIGMVRRNLSEGQLDDIIHHICHL